MTISDVARAVEGKVVASQGHASREVLGAYCSDLLSDVLASASEGDVWITLQRHINVIAVASLKGLSGIIMVNGKVPESDCLEKAESEGLPIVCTSWPAFEVAGVLYGLGLRGRRP